MRALFSHLASLWNGLVGLTWPVDCLSCSAPVEWPGFCAACAALLEPRAGPRCPRCDASTASVPGLGPCVRCHARPPPFQRAWGRFDYAGPIGHAIRAAKYRGRPDAVAVVAETLAACLPEALRVARPDLVVPVPLHPRRLAERGVDVPRLLAVEVARALGVPLAPRALRRIRHTPPQASFDDDARRRGVAGVFEARRSLLGADVLLVDDVVTTGATASEATATLLGAGARRVRVLAAAFVERDR